MGQSFVYLCADVGMAHSILFLLLLLPLPSSTKLPDVLWEHPTAQRLRLKEPGAHLPLGWANGFAARNATFNFPFEVCLPTAEALTLQRG